MSVRLKIISILSLRKFSPLSSLSAPNFFAIRSPKWEGSSLKSELDVGLLSLTLCSMASSKLELPLISSIWLFKTVNTTRNHMGFKINLSSMSVMYWIVFPQKKQIYSAGTIHSTLKSTTGQETN
jgi:hypothetical protein